MAGILTIPPDPNGHSILIPWGAGAYPSSGRNRLRARFARYMAERGYHALRFDYTGVGESTGEYRRGNLKHPYSDEIRVAARWLVDAAPDHLMVVANCFGAWSTLTAVTELPPTEAVCLINSPLGRDHFDLRADEVSRVSPLSVMKRVTLEKLRRSGSSTTVSEGSRGKDHANFRVEPSQVSVPSIHGGAQRANRTQNASHDDLWER
jgi:pimeloyl-ACP methyl ester carboxylesterase